jgi:hypothetical protein
LIRVNDRWTDRIVAALEAAGVPLDDDELASRLGASQRQTINIVCRRLESAGRLSRLPGPRGKNVNSLVINGSNAPPASPDAPQPPATTLLTEDEVKAATKTYLENHGWSVTIAWGRAHGIDIEAHRGTEHLYLEAKGESGNTAQQVSYFIGALGELVQRLRDPTAIYGVALPDNGQYRRLVERLPRLAWERLNLTVLLVDKADRVSVQARR